MKIILTIEERDYLLKLLGDKNPTLRSKLLKEPRKRQESSYKKCQLKEKKEKEEIENLIHVNYKMSNSEIMGKVKISKSLFYKRYGSYVKELRELYKSQALF